MLFAKIYQKKRLSLLCSVTDETLWWESNPQLPARQASTLNKLSGTQHKIYYYILGVSTIFS